MIKIIKTLFLLFLVIIVNAQNYTNEDYLYVPDVFTSQVKASFLEDIHKGIINLEDLPITKKADKWTVFSDRSKNKLYNSYQGNSNRVELDFRDELYVLDIRNNWLKVVTKDKVEEEKEGWIKAENLILSRYSLNTEEKNGVSVPMKRIILTNLDDMSRYGINPEDAIEMRNFYSQPVAGTQKEFEGVAKSFMIYFVLKSYKESYLLATTDVLGGVAGDNNAKIVGWVSGANVRDWDNRIALEPTRTKDAIDQYGSQKLKGYTDLEFINP